MNEQVERLVKLSQEEAELIITAITFFRAEYSKNADRDLCWGIKEKLKRSPGRWVLDEEKVFRVISNAEAKKGGPVPDAWIKTMAKALAAEGDLMRWEAGE